MTAQNIALPSFSPQQAADLLRGGASLVADQVSAALPNMVSPAIEHLSAKPGKDAGVAGARQLLTSNRDELRRRFVARLKEAQDQAIDRLLAREKPGGGALKITADSLSLMDDAEDSPADIAGTVARRMRGSMEATVGDLQLILKHVTGKETIQGEDDPFGPDLCMKSLLEVARDLKVEQNGWSALLGALERPMTDALAGSHAALKDHFRRHRLDAADIRREKAAKQALGKPALGPITASPAAKRPDWLEEVPRVDATPSAMASPPAVEVRASLENMIERMSAAARGAPVPLSLAAAGRPPSDLLDAISDMQRLGAQEAAMGAAAPGMAAPGPGAVGAPVEGAAVPEQALWRDALLAKSTRTVDKLTIEIVGMLFEHVLQDNQVPAELKAVLSRLQFPVLKVALTDADFFASGAHPARRLIDRLASTSVGWESYGDENMRFKAEVERIVQQVLERFDKDVGTFEQLLTEFESFIGEMPTRETDPVARAKVALEEAEKREVLVINTTIQVRRAFEHVELEPYLREFLVGPWVQALVNATLRDEQTPGFSKAFRQAIHDVVWSVQPKVSPEERKRLVTLIPEMTKVLRDGMAMAKMSADDQQAFLKQLMASHAVAVRPVDQATYIKAKVAAGDLRQKIDEMRISGTFPIASPAGGMKVSTQAVKRAAESHAASLVIAEPIAGGAPISFEQDAEYDAKIASWQRGSWFNLHDGKQTVKVKLRWISPLRTLYMFSGSEEKDKGARVLSPETIKSYLRQGWLKPLEAEPLMKRAVDRVVGDFERSPKRAEQLAEKIGATEAPRMLAETAAVEAPRLP